jgi:hypothetical protein
LRCSPPSCAKQYIYISVRYFPPDSSLYSCNHFFIGPFPQFPLPILRQFT